MSGEKMLTKEIAEQYLADEDSVDLSEFTAIEDAAAESLSKHEEDLYLDDLTDEDIVQRLREMGPCPMGFAWHREGSGWRCGGGSHFVHDDDPMLQA